LVIGFEVGFEYTALYVSFGLFYPTYKKAFGELVIYSFSDCVEFAYDKLSIPFSRVIHVVENLSASLCEWYAKVVNRYVFHDYIIASPA